ncbi:MAG: hypothetical protein ABI995_04125 [Acidobacteriota bacterium]
MRKWIPLIVLGSVLMGASAYWFYTRPYDAIRMVEMLPPDRSVHVYIDFGLLRSAGILDVLAGSKQMDDPGYKKFVDESGFDYRKDLDALSVAFRDGDVYYAARGRFNWTKFAAYAPSHGGSCDRFLCKTPGTEPGRDVSYYMPRSDVLAVATSRTATAGDMVAPGSWQNPPYISPTVGVWVSAPPFAFTDLTKLPSGTRSFVSPLAQALGTTFSLGAAPAGGAFQLTMNVLTRTPDDATKLVKQLTEVTGLLVKMLAREKMQPSPSDLSGVLSSGRFESKADQVTGTWPISRAFVESLASSVDLGKKK